MEVTGRNFMSDIQCIKNADGDWEVVVRMQEKRKLDGKDEWEEKEVSSKCTDKSYAKAYQVAMDATLLKFQDQVSLIGNNSLFPETVD